MRFECYGQTQVTPFLSFLVLFCLVLLFFVLSCHVCTRASFLCTLFFTQSLSSPPFSSSHSSLLYSLSPSTPVLILLPSPYFLVSSLIPPILCILLLLSIQLLSPYTFIHLTLNPFAVTAMLIHVCAHAYRACGGSCGAIESPSGGAQRPTKVSDPLHHPAYMNNISNVVEWIDVLSGRRNV